MLTAFAIVECVLLLIVVASAGTMIAEHRKRLRVLTVRNADLKRQCDEVSMRLDVLRRRLAGIKAVLAP